MSIDLQSYYWLGGAIALIALVLLLLFMAREKQYRRRAIALQQQGSQSEQQRQHLEQQLEALMQQYKQQQATAENLWSKLQGQSQRLGVYSGQLEQFKEVKERLDEAEQALRHSRQAEAEAQAEVAQLKFAVEQGERRYREQFALLKENREQLKVEFEHISQRIFEDKRQQFDSNSIKSLDGVLAPLKTQLESFRKRVDNVHSEQLQGQAGLRNELDNLRRLNQQITDEAANLTRALKGDKKLQGNFGEQQAELLLQQSGLRRDIEYRREANFKDAEQQNRRPDFIIDLPDGKHIIIDSKVSLNAYAAFVSAEDEGERQRQLKAHVGCIEAHINSLSEKDYPKLEGMQSPDFVFMFMPIEPAFLAALEASPGLFNKAYDKRIAVVTPTTLLPMLRTVASLWTIDKQNNSTEQLADQAAKVYDRLRVFVEKMEKLGGQINTAQATYDTAWRSLYSGRGNLVAQAEKFKELGVRTKKEMPTSVTQSLMEEPLIKLEDDAADSRSIRQ
ncbi:DNA recombination protein RmuC [Sinobacterium caligoides]|nr:DNA recombination protein RmuC [Sinobacterium caligoides]